MRSKIVIQKPTDTSVGLIGVDSLLEVYDNTKSGDLVVVYPGTYDLGANGIKLKDGVNFLFMPGVVINSTNPNGAFYDDGVEVHCTIQGSPKIINGAGAAINLTNQSSSCPLNNKNLTVHNLPDPVLFNEGDIVTLEGGATYKHNGTTWKPLVDEYDLYIDSSNYTQFNQLIETIEKLHVSVFVDLGDNQDLLIDELWHAGKKYLKMYFRVSYPGVSTIVPIRGLISRSIHISSNLSIEIRIGKNTGVPSAIFGLDASDITATYKDYTVSVAQGLVALTGATQGQYAYVQSHKVVYKLEGSDPTQLINWKPQVDFGLFLKEAETLEIIRPEYMTFDINGDDDPDAALSAEFGNNLPIGTYVIYVTDEVGVKRYAGEDSWDNLSYDDYNIQTYINFYGDSKTSIRVFGFSCLQYDLLTDFNEIDYVGYSLKINDSTIADLDVRSTSRLLVQNCKINNFYTTKNLKYVGDETLGYYHYYYFENTSFDTALSTLALQTYTVFAMCAFVGCKLPYMQGVTKSAFILASYNFHTPGNYSNLFTTNIMKNCLWHDGSPMYKLDYRIMTAIFVDSSGNPDALDGPKIFEEGVLLQSTITASGPSILISVDHVGTLLNNLGSMGIPLFIGNNVADDSALLGRVSDATSYSFRLYTNTLPADEEQPIDAQFTINLIR